MQKIVYTICCMSALFCCLLGCTIPRGNVQGQLLRSTCEVPPYSDISEKNPLIDPGKPFRITLNRAFLRYLHGETEKDKEALIRITIQCDNESPYVTSMQMDDLSRQWQLWGIFNHDLCDKALSAIDKVLIRVEIWELDNVDFQHLLSVGKAILRIASFLSPVPKVQEQVTKFLKNEGDIADLVANALATTIKDDPEFFVEDTWYLNDKATHPLRAGLYGYFKQESYARKEASGTSKSAFSPGSMAYFLENDNLQIVKQYSANLIANASYSARKALESDYKTIDVNARLAYIDAMQIERVSSIKEVKYVWEISILLSDIAENLKKEGDNGSFNRVLVEDLQSAARRLERIPFQPTGVIQTAGATLPIFEDQTYIILEVFPENKQALELD